MIIAIGMVGVSYKNWLKWTAKLFLLEGVISVAIMLFCVWIGYQ